MNDPLRPPRGAANIGAAGLSRNGYVPGEAPLWELGDVLAYNSTTHTSTIRTHSGRPLQNVPQIKGTAGSYDHLIVGTTVVICWNLGFPAIIGYIDIVGPKQQALPSPTLTGLPVPEYEGLGQPGEGVSSFKPPGAPTDMVEGDWAQVGSLGNHVAVLEGGVSLLGTPNAHFQSLGPNGMLRMVSRQLQQLTDFGTVTIENDEGRTSYILRAGSNQATETGYDEQHWTIRLDMGAAGDLLNFRITEPQGKILFSVQVGPDGNVQIYGDGGVDVSSGPNGSANTRHDIQGDRVTRIKGSEDNLVQGDMTLTVDGDETKSVAGARVSSVAMDSTEYIGGAMDVAITDDETRVIGAGRRTHIIEDDVTSVDGDATIDAGKTLTANGRQIKLGSSASEPLIKGNAFNSGVMTQIAAAANALSLASSGAQLVLNAFPGPPVTTGAAMSLLMTGIASAASALQGAVSAYASTLSAKVKTE